MIASLCDDVNCFIDENKPWLLAKEADKSTELHQVVSLGLFAFRMLAIYLTPIIPDITGKIAQFFREEPFVWGEIDAHPLGCKVNNFSALSVRIEEQNIQNLFKEVQSMENSSLENIEKDMVSIEDFLKVKLKVGKILEAEDIQD